MLLNLLKAKEIKTNLMPLKNDGIMVILSSPSAGKTTLVKLLSKRKNFKISIFTHDKKT